MDVPSLRITNKELQNLVRFIYGHDETLKQFGAIKLELDQSCNLSLKTRQKSLKRALVSSWTIQQSKYPSIYFVENETSNKQMCIRKPSPVQTQASFWSNLSRSEKHRYQIATFPNKSEFCEKALRNSFDIHQIPTRSLLKLGGAHLTRAITPSLKHAYEPRTIFPLSSAAHHLYLLDYHHEGGAHHWYVIPNSERVFLNRLIKPDNLSKLCLDHGKIFIDPSVLEKHAIRYHHIKQHPNEFVVLAPGALAQHYTEDASWNESIVFALPSWIDDGHAHAGKMKTCSCPIQDDHTPKIIDLTRFRKQTIQNYITKRLKSLHDSTEKTEEQQNECLNTSILSCSDFETTQSVYEAPLYEHHQNDDFDSFVNEQTSNDKSLRSALEESIDHCMNNDQTHYSSSIIGSNSNTTSIPSLSSEQTEKQPNNHRKQHLVLVWNIDKRVRKREIHRHFPGSYKVVLKPYKGACNLQYAFVYHFTSWEAKKNVERSRNLSQLGADCYAEPGRDVSKFVTDPTEHADHKILSITRIPEHVTENEVKHLFTGCHLLKFCPARLIEGNPRTGKPSKVLKGYAFLRYDTVMQAKHVIEHGNHYSFHGQPVIVSFKNARKNPHHHKK